MSDRSRLRLFILQLLVLSLFVTLLSRLWFLQIMDGAQFVAKQEATSPHTISTPAARGRIVDAQGRKLATNVSTYVVSVQIKDFPHELPANKKNRTNPVRAKVIHALGGLLQMNETELSDRTTLCEYAKDSAGHSSLKTGKKGLCWNGSPYQPIPILRDVPLRQAFLIEEHAEDFPGVDATLEAVRSYPNGELAAHMLGYIQPSNDAKEAGELVGQTGLELQYDQYLRGVPGSREFETNRAGVETREVSSRDPVPGSDLVLSIDTGVQKVAEDALANAIKRAHALTDPCKDCPTAGTLLKAPAGAAVVLEAKTGRIAAMASYPTYDPSKFLKGIDEGSADYKYLFDKKTTPMVSRAYQGQYAPGSTFKHVTTAAAIENGNSLDGTYLCPPTYKIGSQSKSNFEGVGIDGPISWHRTLVESCDTVYYQIAYHDWLADEQRIKDRQQPLEQMQQWAAKFGFGQNTGIDLPGEQNGAIPTRKWLRELDARNRPTNCKLADELPHTHPQWALVVDLCKNGSRYQAGDQANAAVGQGYVLATPLQLAVSYAAIVNGGKMMVPKVAKAIIAPGGASIREIPPEVRSTLPLDQKVLDYIRSALADVPKAGTAKCAFGMAGPTTDCKQLDFKPFPFDKLDVGGKTGTAQVSNRQDTSWFASFGPVADPRYVVVVMIEQGGTGGTVAAPATREIWDGIYGLESKPAALVDGALPTRLPVVAPDGTILRPGGRVTTTTTPSASVGTTTPSAGGASTPAPSGKSAPPVSLPPADLPTRRNGGW